MLGITIKIIFLILFITFTIGALLNYNNPIIGDMIFAIATILILIGLIIGYFWLKSSEANISDEEIEEAYGQRGLTDEEKAEVEKLAKAFIKDILKNQNNKDKEVA